MRRCRTASRQCLTRCTRCLTRCLTRVAKGAFGPCHTISHVSAHVCHLPVAQTLHAAFVSTWNEEQCQLLPAGA